MFKEGSARGDCAVRDGGRHWSSGSKAGNAGSNSSVTGEAGSKGCKNLCHQVEECLNDEIG